MSHKYKLGEIVNVLVTKKSYDCECLNIDFCSKCIVPLGLYLSLQKSIEIIKYTHTSVKELAKHLGFTYSLLNEEYGDGVIKKHFLMFSKVILQLK